MMESGAELDVGAVAERSADSHNFAVEEEQAPMSSRDPRRFEASRTQQSLEHLIAQLDAPTCEFYRKQIEGTPLFRFIRQNLISPYCNLTLHTVLERSSFRRDPARLRALLANLKEFQQRAEAMLQLSHAPASTRDAVLSEVLHRIARYSGSLYNWQDNPDLHEEQRSLLREETTLPLVLEIISEDFREQAPPEQGDSLAHLVQSLVSLTRRMAHAGLLKKARSEVVLKWCKVNIRRTTQRYLDARGAPCLSEPIVRELTNVKLRAVIFNILLDDLADDVQDRAKFELFRGIAGSEEGAPGPVSADRYQALLRQVPEEWGEYLRLSVQAWNSFLYRLEQLVGREAFQKHSPQLKSDYDAILGSMSYALTLNTSVDPVQILRDDAGMVLSHNMNMMSFETMDRMALERADPAVSRALDEDPELYRAIRAVNLLLQYNGQLGNSTATLDAEIDENCLANEVVYIAAQRPGGEEIYRLYQRRREVLARRDMKTYAELGASIREIIERTDTRSIYFEKWVRTKRRILEIIAAQPRVREVLDVPAMLEAGDELLVTSWVYRGDI